MRRGTKSLARQGRTSALIVLLIAGPAAVSHPARAQQATAQPALTFSNFGSRLLAAAVNRRDAADSNTVLSPVSAGLALSLASLGAEGQTASALATVLGTAGLSRDGVIDRGQSLIDRTSNRTDVQLEVANAIWFDSLVTPAAPFAAAASRWQATIGTLHLASSDAVRAINSWAAHATHDKITRLLDKPLPDTTMLFIANAVYFKGKWASPFEKSATRPHDFSLLSGRRIMVAAMSRTGHFDYARDSGYQVVRLPYAGDHVAMYVILPDSGTVGRLENKIARSGWPRTLSAASARSVHLILPKIHVEQETDLQPSISRLGAGIAFDCNSADFRNLATDRKGRAAHPICIGKALQKVYIDVDEEGTEAAAVTGIGMVTATSVQLPVEFVVDRPFLFVVRDESTGADLFVGSIRRP